MAVAGVVAGGQLLAEIRRQLRRRRLLRWQNLPATGGVAGTVVAGVVVVAVGDVAAAAAVAAVAVGCDGATERLRRQRPKPVDGRARDSYLRPEWSHRHRPASSCTVASAIGLVGRSLP